VRKGENNAEASPTIIERRQGKMTEDISVGYCINCDREYIGGDGGWFVTCRKTGEIAAVVKWTICFDCLEDIYKDRFLQNCMKGGDRRKVSFRFND
jgi:hypothetical protein